MGMPEKIKSALKLHKSGSSCTKCPYYGGFGDDYACMPALITDVLAYFQQLEEQIEFMKIQMQGDCGVCVHRYDERTLPDDQLKCKLSPACYECLKKGGHSQWEYEGLPALPEKGAPNEL